MTCPRCAKGFDTGDAAPGSRVFCPQCGTALTTPKGTATAPPPAPAPADVPVARTAVASQVFALLSCVPLAGVPALILSIVALVKIKRSKGALGGTALAVCGGVIGLVATGFTAVVVVTNYAPVLWTSATSGACKQRVARIGAALDKFHADKGYEASELHALVEAGYLTEDDLHCPDNPSSDYTLVRYDLAAEEDLRVHEGKANHGGGRVVLTFDGAVEVRPEGDFEAMEFARKFWGGGR